MREQQTMQDGSIFVKKLEISLVTNEENEKQKRYDCKNLAKKDIKKHVECFWNILRYISRDTTSDVKLYSYHFAN